MRDEARAERIVGAVMRALGQQVRVDRAEQRTVAIGVVDDLRAARRVDQLEAIRKGGPRAGHPRLEESAVVRASHRQAFTLRVSDHRYLAGAGPEYPDHHLASHRVRPQHPERVAVAAGRQRGDIGGGKRSGPSGHGPVIVLCGCAPDPLL